MFIFEIGSLICGVAPSSTAFIIGRAVAGIGGAGLFSGGLTIVSAASKKEQRPSKELEFHDLDMTLISCGMGRNNWPNIRILHARNCGWSSTGRGDNTEGFLEMV